MWFFFFFSSRRRHTRFDCDWSSDVCSSDLQLQLLVDQAQLTGDAQPRAVLLDSSVRLHQTEFTGVFGAEEKIQVGVLAEIPVRPSMRPVRPSKIAGVIAQDFHGTQLARSISRIKNELRAAFRPGGSFFGGRLLFLSRPFHFRAGLGRK